VAKIAAEAAIIALCATEPLLYPHEMSPVAQVVRVFKASRFAKTHAAIVDGAPQVFGLPYDGYMALM
jgi:hypothetical protein